MGRKFASVAAAAYAHNTRFFVPLVSQHYGRKHFPLREFIAAKDEESTRPEEFILPLRLDDSSLPGLDPDVLYIDLRETPLAEAVRVLLAKLHGLPDPALAPPSEWVATFGLLIEELLKNWRLPDSVSTYYPALCDWLERDVHARLQHAGLRQIYQPEPSARNGETLSVRFAFRLEGHSAALDFGDLAWWELLEPAPFSDIYPAA